MIHSRLYQRLYPLLVAVCCTIVLGGCSMNQLVAKSSLGLIDAGVRSMNQETDLEFARASIPANLKLTESLIDILPTDRSLRIAAAQGFYGYAFGFIEDDTPERASLLYKRGLDHALAGLAEAGVKINLLKTSAEDISHAIASLDQQAVPELFWVASNWGKWIDLNRNDPARIADLAKTERLMQRVLELDPDYYYGSPHLFFGVYYGSRPPMLGGDFAKSAMHFDQAAALSHDQWLITEVLRAQFLLRQMGDRTAFHEHLSKVLATENSPPEMALVNAIARAKAQRLLSQEEDLF